MQSTTGLRAAHHVQHSSRNADPAPTTYLNPPTGLAWCAPMVGICCRATRRGVMRHLLLLRRPALVWPPPHPRSPSAPDAAPATTHQRIHWRSRTRSCAVRSCAGIVRATSALTALGAPQQIAETAVRERDMDAGMEREAAGPAVLNAGRGSRRFANSCAGCHGKDRQGRTERAARRGAGPDPASRQGSNDATCRTPSATTGRDDVLD